MNQYGESVEPVLLCRMQLDGLAQAEKVESSTVLARSFQIHQRFTNFSQPLFLASLHLDLNYVSSCICGVYVRVILSVLQCSRSVSEYLDPGANLFIIIRF